MKVTKLIREYVEEQVATVYDSKENPYTEKAKADRQKINDFKEELLNQQQESIDKFFEENPHLDYWRNYTPFKAAASIPIFTHAVTQNMMDEEQWRKENSRLKNAKIREIMVSLELGASRQELNEMIAKLMED